MARQCHVKCSGPEPKSGHAGTIEGSYSLSIRKNCVMPPSGGITQLLNCIDSSYTLRYHHVTFQPLGRP